jgi:hypothetical protein
MSAEAERQQSAQQAQPKVQHQQQPQQHAQPQQHSQPQPQPYPNQFPPQFPPQFHPAFAPQQGMPYWPGYMPQMPQMPQMPGQMNHPYAPHSGQGQSQGNGITQAMQEIANGGSGLSSLSKLLDFDDKDFWKGAMVGAAAILLLTNENVQRALFRGAVKGRNAVEGGVEKVKEGVDKMKQKASATQENDDE